jgi:hypothetical protein
MRFLESPDLQQESRFITPSSPFRATMGNKRGFNFIILKRVPKLFFMQSLLDYFAF